MIQDIFQTMNTVAQIKIEGKNEQNALETAKAVILDIEKRFNFFSPNSEISKLCKNIHVGERYVISKEMYEILEVAKKVKKDTLGLFDVDFLNKEKQKDYHLENGGAIIFDSNKTRLNLGAIAKGFAADKALEMLKEYDMERVMISLGGQVSCFSKSKPWRAGLQNPNADFGELLGAVEITNGSLSTSAENYRGKHIKNPKRSDWQSNVSSVSVFNEKGILADAYSTALFLSDKMTQKKLVQSLKLSVIIVDGEIIRVSPTLKDKFIPFNDNINIKVI